MNITYYHVDTFANKIFTGNPAGVCLLGNFLGDVVLQKIAAENGLPVTTFINIENSQIHLRWFTPDDELDLCGHGTLAAAYVIFNHMNINQEVLQLNSAKAGLLHVRKTNDIIEINFPRKNITQLSVTDFTIDVLGFTAQEVYQHKGERILLVLEDENMVQNLRPNFEMLKGLEHRGLVVTAPSEKVDFVSRTFYLHKAIPEDSVTGSSHCLLVPYWAKRLGKTVLHTHQVSRRGGELFCSLEDNGVIIGGKAVLYSEGNIFLQP